MKRVFAILVLLCTYGMSQEDFPRPQNFNLNWYYQVGNFFDLSWEIPDTSNTEAVLSGYHIYRNFIPLDTLPPDSFSYSDTDPPPLDEISDWNVYYFMTAFYANPDGESAPTDTLFHDGATISVDESFEDKPLSFRIVGAYPNPFNPSVTIEYEVSESGRIEIQIIDLMGHVAAVLADDYHVRGDYLKRWDSVNLSSGVYVLKIGNGKQSTSKKLLMLK